MTILAWARLQAAFCPVVSLGLGLAACTSDHDFPCQPILHATQGDRGNPRIEQRYSLIGGSFDRRRLAVVFAHIGPSSGAPFANLVVYQAGSRRLVLHRSTFMWGASRPEDVESELQAGQESLLTTYAAELRETGILVGENLPTPLAWCSADDRVFVDGPPEREWIFSSVEETCPPDSQGSAMTALLFRLCPVGWHDETTCLRSTHEPDWDCTAGQQNSLLDVLASGSILWGVARRHTNPLATLEFNQLSVGGR